MFQYLVEVGMLTEDSTVEAEVIRNDGIPQHYSYDLEDLIESGTSPNQLIRELLSEGNKEVSIKVVK